MKNGSVVQECHELSEPGVSEKNCVCVAKSGRSRIAGGQHASNEALVAARALCARGMAFRRIIMLLFLTGRILSHCMIGA